MPADVLFDNLYRFGFLLMRGLLCFCRNKVLENLSKLQHAPSVQFSERPPEIELHENVRFLPFFVATSRSSA